MQANVGRFEKLKGDERGAVNFLITVTIALTVLVVVALLAVYISATIYNTMSPELSKLNSTNPTVYGQISSVSSGVLSGLQIFGGFIPIVILVAVAAIVIAIVQNLRRGGEGGL